MSSFAFAHPRRARRPDLTPMIDVVFLLLVFFMLVSRFGIQGVLPLTPAGGAATASWEGPPRVVDLYANGDIRLNGEEVFAEHLSDWLHPLMPAPDSAVIIRTHDADLQRLVDTVDHLSNAGITRLIVME
ncbi:biopolymer transport protein ExbD [Celeribacter baekdonensis]|jgi:biopolymer transport protein ExbD|uniref:Biopolymer transport protein ExbD n=1 Tax=Celeribacter baekdonensis TaxID=875171 RepID=A0A1G7HTI1_9RHOB|nr:biopolymer transporter ExbD [Celeribacter baekdonensis]SDF03811.1 biopolymer transport protein ExbD [Celeribacter baekdonensis]